MRAGTGGGGRRGAGPNTSPQMPSVPERSPKGERVAQPVQGERRKEIERRRRRECASRHCPPKLSPREVPIEPSVCPSSWLLSQDFGRQTNFSTGDLETLEPPASSASCRGERPQ